MSLVAFAAATTSFAQVNEFTVKVNKTGAEIQPTMYGIFIEDINFAADGGLYAELVKNRSNSNSSASETNNGDLSTRNVWNLL